MSDSSNVPGITVPTKQAPTSNTKPNRLPAPTLFVGPPSRNASQLSVSRTAIEGNLKAIRDPLIRQKSALSRPNNADSDTAAAGEGAQANKDLPSFKKPTDKDIDARWREMQNTLNEVELTAQSSTHVFGASHAKALDDLRNAQVALARAWGRGNETQASAASKDGSELNVARFKGVADGVAADLTKTGQKQRSATETAAFTVAGDENVAGDAGGKSAESAGGHGQLEDETARDIKLAGERRAANEAYFKKVDQGVKEVVEKLVKVADAMRDVEGESRSLWSNSDRSSNEARSARKLSAQSDGGV